MVDDTHPTPESLEPPRPAFGHQQIVASILTLVVLAIVFVVVLPQFGDYAGAWEAVRTMQTWQFGFIGAATIGLIILYVYPYTTAMPDLGFKHGFYTRQTSFMISNVIPGGGAWGLAVQYGMLSSYGYSPSPVTAAIGITSVWNTLVTLSLPLVAVMGLTITGQTGADDVTRTILAAFLFALMVGGLALVLRSEHLARKIGGIANSVIGWGASAFSKNVRFDAAKTLVDFRTSIIDVVAERWLVITVANVGQQLAQFSILYFAVVALQGGFDGPISLPEAFAAFALGRLATFLPIPPGGLGTTDAIITSMLAGFGLAQNEALAATLVWRALTYFPQVIIGVITLLLWRRDSARKAAAG